MQQVQDGEVLQRRLQKEAPTQTQKQCEEHVRLAAERAAELHDEKLFTLPPPLEDCPTVFYDCRHLVRGRDIKHVVEKLYAADVFMHLYMTTKAIKLIIKSVPFVELQLPIQLKMQSKGIRKE